MRVISGNVTPIEEEEGMTNSLLFATGDMAGSYPINLWFSSMGARSDAIIAMLRLRVFGEGGNLIQRSS